MIDTVSHIKEYTAANAVYPVETIQSLWSGYGKIERYRVEEGEVASVVVKLVQPSKQNNHPRGWNSSLSHDRKVRSYKVETSWYTNYNEQCDEYCRVPKCLGITSEGSDVLIVLEDLDATGYSVRKTTVSIDEMKVCLSWLANFHATFLQSTPVELWEVGTYWHLETRPDELKALKDQPLKEIAQELDDTLSNCRYKSFVHGDAKLANFCFSEEGTSVAAVDFQYVGGGCGMKDVAYFIGSCINEHECDKYEDELLNYYFAVLKVGLERKNSKIEFDLIEKEWRALFPIAWTDFHRFLKGWSPSHWKLNSYSERIAQKVIDSFGTK